jgi:hypothetical protein
MDHDQVDVDVDKLIHLGFMLQWPNNGNWELADEQVGGSTDAQLTHNRVYGFQIVVVLMKRVDADAGNWDLLTP